MRGYTPWGEGATASFTKRSRQQWQSDALVSSVIDLTATLTGLERDELVGERRFSHLVEPRVAAYVAIRVLSNGSVSLPRIGLAFNRNHTTVMHALAHPSRYAEELAEEIIEAYEAEMAAPPALRAVGE